MSEGQAEINPQATGEIITFKHPEEGKYDDPQAKARIEREKSWGQYFSEGASKISKGQDPNPIILGWAQHVTDIEDTGQKRAQQLEATRDELLTDEKTGSGNERKFLDDLNGALGKENVGLLMLDLDGFKSINDSLGHDAGDEAIVWFNRLIQSRLRSGDQENGQPRTADEIYHLHGDEHAVLIHDITQEGLREAAERIRVSVQDANFEHNGQMRKLTTSIGGVMVNKEEGIMGNLKSADIALYKAKSAGKNRTEIHVPETDSLAA